MLKRSKVSRAVLACVAWLAISGPATAQDADGKQRQSISQYGITWQFDRPVQAGQFVTGDWWVLGPVKVTEISPEPGPVQNDDMAEVESIYGATGAQQDNRMRNGSMVVEQVRGKQGYDSRLKNYDADLSVSLPIALRPGTSLISTVSAEIREQKPLQLFHERMWPSEKRGWLALKSAAVLTVLDEAPPADAFRPPYAGGDKPIFRYSDLDTSKLRDLDPPQSRPDFEEFERYLQRPWLDHTTGWLHQLTGPHENQVNYGREFTRITSMAGLMLNTRATMEEKKDLLIGLTQLGIDLVGVVNAGRQYYADGGHYSGRKFPIVFAGALLGNEKMMRIGESTKFAEDQQTYYGTGWAGQRALYQIVVHTGPKPPHEEIRPENWNQHHKRAESYRRVNGMGWPATALVVRVMGLTDAWNHDAFFDYNDRWMSPDAPFAAHAVDRERNKMEGQATDPFVNDMWAQYHDRLPEIDRDGPHRKWVEKDGGQWVENEIPSEAEAKRHAKRVAAD